MSSRLPKHLHDALNAARLAVGFVRGLDDATYAADVLVRSGVERQLEILGEACRRALDDTPELSRRLPDMLYAVALRNRIIHGYDRLENIIVLETVRRDLPPLMAGLEQELSGFQPP